MTSLNCPAALNGSVRTDENYIWITNLNSWDPRGAMQKYVQKNDEKEKLNYIINIMI